MKPALSLTDIIHEHTLQAQELTQRHSDLIQQVNVVTKQRDALLVACRSFVLQTRSAFDYLQLERLLEEMKDIVTVEVPE